MTTSLGSKLARPLGGARLGYFFRACLFRTRMQGLLVQGLLVQGRLVQGRLVQGRPMQGRLVLGALVYSLILLSCTGEPSADLSPSTDAGQQRKGPVGDPVGQDQYREYAGVYVAGPLAFLQIEAVEQWLVLDPPSWTGRPYLAKTGSETFSLALPHEAAHRSVTFFRDGAGSVAGLELENFDNHYDGQRFRRHRGDRPTPGLLFLDRQPVAAARAALADEAITPKELGRFAISQFMSHPTRSADIVAFLEVVSGAHPTSASLMALHGYTLVSLHRRDEARERLEQALALDPEEANAQEGLRRLTQSEPAPGTGYRSQLPFGFAEAYALPTAREVLAVRRAWAERDLSPRNVETVHAFEMELDHGVFAGRILRHEVHGEKHIGAVLVPVGERGPLPIVLDIAGVDTAYSPRDITPGTTTLTALGGGQARFIVVIPALRGQGLILHGDEFAAAGDPSDAWDGATDDTLALLQVALDSTPKADPSRIAILGTSRGGTVALLAAARDQRISLALNLVGPVDHFRAMDRTEGWSKAEVLIDTMADGVASEDEEGYQTFDHFFDRALGAGESLAAVRQRLIASSPLYFVEDLPETHSYYGAEDRAVPIANPQALRRRLDSLGRFETSITVFENAGHDTDSLRVRRDVARRLVHWSGR